MKSIIMYFSKGEGGYKPTPLHFMLALLLAFALSWVPGEGQGAEVINVLPPGQELTTQQEWYLVRDVCYEDAAQLLSVTGFPEEQVSYAGTTGLRRLVLLEKAVYQCDLMLAERSGTYLDWLEYTYQLIHERYDEFIERQSQLRDSPGSVDDFGHDTEVMEPEYQL